MLNVKKTGDAEYGHFINALICGQPGAGKTLISSTFPDPFYASAEGGLMSIADRGIPYVEIDSSRDLLEVAKYMKMKPEDRERALGFPVQTVIIDTIDEIQAILKRERSGGKEEFSQKDWGWLSEKLKAIVVAFRDMDINFVMTCHVALKTDQESGSAWYMPQIQGSFGEQIAGFADVVGLIKSETVVEIVGNKTERVEKRTLYTSPLPKYGWLKDRSGKLEKEMLIDFETDFQRMHDAIYGGLKLKATEEVVPMFEASEVTSLDDAPEKSEPDVKATVREKAATNAAVVDAVKPAKRPVNAPVAGGIPVEPEFEYKDRDGNVVMSRNELPSGIVPVPKGFDTNIYCVETGNEVESDMQADMSRIRYRKILCEEAMKNLKR